MTTIAPCPFCGYDDVEIDEVDVLRIAVNCPECECIGPVSRIGVEEAIDAWNNAHKIRELLAARRKALEAVKADAGPDFMSQAPNEGDGVYRP